jgi:hypothetical protein
LEKKDFQGRYVLDKSISSLCFKSFFCVIFVLTLSFCTEFVDSAEVTLQWNSVPEADGYNIYCGSEPRNYQPPQNAENNTTHTVSLDPGTYFFAVTAYNSYGESGYSQEVSTLITPTNPPTSVSLSSDLPSPQPEGTIVTFTAQADGGSGTYEYRYFLKDPLDQWSAVREYSPEPDYTWTAAGNGESAIQVWARNAGSDIEYSVLDTISFSTAMDPPASVSLISDLPSPQPEGTTVTFTAQADGGSGVYEYRFFLKDPLDQWSVVREYSSEPDYTWTATGNGENTIQVWARNAGSDESYQVLNTIPFTVDSALSVNELSVLVMHVAEIVVSTKKRGANVNAKVNVIVKDNSDVPVEGAIVYGSWGGLTSDRDSSLTDSDGIVLLESDRMKKPSGIFTFTVDNITKDGWTYDSASNIETSSSITVP